MLNDGVTLSIDFYKLPILSNWKALDCIFQAISVDSIILLCILGRKKKVASCRYVNNMFRTRMKEDQ